MNVVVDDQFYCSVEDVERFKETRVWREMRHWIAERRDGVADCMDAAISELEFKCLQQERLILRDLLELPDLIIATLKVRAANEYNEEIEDATADSRTTRIADDDYPAGR